jgi:hypothetical protein
MVTAASDLYALMHELEQCISSDQETDMYLDLSDQERKALEHMRNAFNQLSIAADILSQAENMSRRIEGGEE